MQANHANNSEPNVNELYFDVLRNMYFGSLIYWGNAMLQGHKAMWLGLSSLEADQLRSRDQQD